MPKILLHWYWLFQSYLKKHFRELFLGLAVGILAFYQGPRLLKLIPLNQTVYVGRVGNYTVQTLPLDIQQKISRGLTKINPDGSTTPDAAKEMTISPDGKTFTFKLDDTLTWPHDQSTFSPQDVNYTIEDVAISYPSSNSIAFTLAEPFSPFPIIASQPILKKITGGWPWHRTTIVGLNQYQIRNLDTRDQYLRSLTLSHKGGTLVYRFYPTEADAVTAFKLGLVDKLEYLSNPYLDNWSNLVRESASLRQRYFSLFFNTKVGDLKDKTIRQMLNYATPKDTQKNRIISPVHKNSWAYNPQVKPYDYNLDTAKQMMLKLKASNANLNLSFEITTTPTYAQLAETFKQSWSQLGIQTQIKIVPFPDPKDYQILLIGQEIPDDPDQYCLWHSTQATNITHYQNPKIDKLLEDGRKEFDPVKRKQIYQDFQRFLLEDTPAVFLHELPLYHLSRPTE